MVVTGKQSRSIARSAQAFVADVTSGFRRVEQRENAARYVLGLMVGEGRKSLDPIAQRCGWSSGEYHSAQHFLADAPWDWAGVMQRSAERVSPQIDVRAWVCDDTSFPKSGHGSPGVKRQYCGEKGKRANCQVGVSLHAAGDGALTLPLGWALYLPAEWIDDPERCERAKIPPGTEFQTKHELALGLIDAARSWHIVGAPILGDQAYGDSSEFRIGIDERELTYCLNVSAIAKVYPKDTVFQEPGLRIEGHGRPRTNWRTQCASIAISDLANDVLDEQIVELVYRTTSDRELRGLFSFHRVYAAKPLRNGHSPRQEWLVVQHPGFGHDDFEYWLSNLPDDAPQIELAELARMRWTIELDYKQLKGHLGLNHFEGRSWAGWHKHCALVTVAHAWLTEQRLNPKAQRPD